MSSGIDRLLKIKECIEDIEFILNDNSLKVTKAIENKIIKPAIRMNIVRIAEQFSKLKDDNEFKILENFSNEDLKGISAVRNYIAHDYDSTDDHIIEDVVRYNLPILKKIIVKNNL
ncbi:MAG: HepT-like ribonuclease domain-containing protein [Campylobacterota bacterium]|nr:HepT-like ribonuclease domain-containing protein [Campylobacterota bacterium]